MVQHNMAKEISMEMKMVGLTKDSFGIGRDVNLSLKWISMDCWNFNGIESPTRYC